MKLFLATACALQLVACASATNFFIFAGNLTMGLTSTTHPTIDFRWAFFPSAPSTAGCGAAQGSLVTYSETRDLEGYSVLCQGDGCHTGDADLIAFMAFITAYGQMDIVSNPHHGGQAPLEAFDTDGHVRGHCYPMPRGLDSVVCENGGDVYDAVAMIWCETDMPVSDNAGFV